MNKVITMQERLIAAAKRQWVYAEERAELLRLLKAFQKNPASIVMAECTLSPEQLSELIAAIESDFMINRSVNTAADAKAAPVDPDDFVELNGIPIADLFDEGIQALNKVRKAKNTEIQLENILKGTSHPELPMIPLFGQLTKDDIIFHAERFGVTNDEYDKAVAPRDLFEGLSCFINNNDGLGQQFYITHVPMKGVGRQIRLWNIFPTKHNRTSLTGVYRLSQVIPSEKDVRRMKPLKDDPQDVIFNKKLRQQPHYVLGKV